MNIAEHFFQSVGWESLAKDAAQANLGEFCYGAIFAVKNHLLTTISPDVLNVMQSKKRQHSLYPYIFERLWLHMFGLPFLKIAKSEQS